MQLSDTIMALSARFPAEDHKHREQGGRKLTYIGIDGTIGRLNEVLGNEYSTEIRDLQFQGEFVYVLARLSYTDDKGAHRFKDGVGADKVDPRDPDKSLKTAYAEAIKKAAHQLGVALYLWDKEEVKAIEQEQRLQSKPVQQPAKPQVLKTDSTPNDPITEPQIQALSIQIQRVFGKGDADITRAKEFIGQYLGRDIKSRKELTKVEADDLIEKFKKTAAGKFFSKKETA